MQILQNQGGNLEK